MYLDEFDLQPISDLVDKYPGRLSLSLKGEPFLLYKLPPAPLTNPRAKPVKEDKRTKLAEFEQLLKDYYDITQAFKEQNSAEISN